MAMNKWVKRKWVRALRSGEYEQSQSTLIEGVREGRTSYCCLGVLGAEMVPEFCTIPEVGYYGKVDDREDILPDDLAILYGLDEATQNMLAEMNDDGRKFTTIADWIEKNL